MPAMEPVQQQAPMTAGQEIISQQPTTEAMPSTQDVSMRGGEEASCEICCGLCACDEGCC